MIEIHVIYIFFYKIGTWILFLALETRRMVKKRSRINRKCEENDSDDRKKID